MLLLERTLLNFMQRLSGVATLTRQFVDRLEGTKARLVDTRKTLPDIELSISTPPVSVGPAIIGVDWMAESLIKDNHLRAAGGVSQGHRKSTSLGLTFSED